MMTANIEMLSGYDDVLVVDDVMKILHIGRNNTLRMLRDGEIKSIRIGTKYRIPKIYLIQYLSGLEEEV